MRQLRVLSMALVAALLFMNVAAVQAGITLNDQFAHSKYMSCVDYPFEDFTTIEYRVPEKFENLAMVVRYEDGTLMDLVRLNGYSGRVTLDLRECPNGMYSITLVSGRAKLDKIWIMKGPIR